MSTQDGRFVRLLSIPAAAAERLSAYAVDDAVSYFDPDGLLVPGERSPRGHATVRNAASARPAIHPQLGRADDGIEHVRFGPDGRRSEAAGPPSPGAIDLLAVHSGDVLAALGERLASGERSTGADAATYLFVPELSIEADTTALSADLPHAADVAAIADELPEPVVVLAGGQPAGYHHVWRLAGRDAKASVEVAVVGLGGGGPDGGEDRLAGVACTARGAAAAETVPPDSFGLRALEGVGPAIADRLGSLGCRTRGDVRNTAVSELAALEGLGREGAERLHAHAEVIASGEPLVLTNETPVRTRSGRPPLCLDVETDGLSPTIIWQFGVYDPAADAYRAFTERSTPTDPAGVLGEFIEWLLGTHADRTLLTWNGSGFDYPQIERFLRRHYPEYVDAWRDLWTYDLYQWAVRDGNALLPGRTNRLDDVARALGYERAASGLSGAQTAAAYRRFMRRPTDPAAEPDWERHEAYCRDDCEALYRVYDAIETADRRDVTDSGAGGAAGRQSGLTEF
ncbi:ribonuclease H-like domain-containing protein [Natronomonas sp.]|uniref:ribonuclease H-like domain-containing protein n=1 Tax=Natronomonas sp. TaxID=2184060 RepID=UPI002603A6F2|nr:ribonuclease H-like domain-containing protein [Natronomonas sp.]